MKSGNNFGDKEILSGGNTNTRTRDLVRRYINHQSSCHPDNFLPLTPYSHRSVSPSAHRTSEQPARIVSCAPIASSDGLTSTCKLTSAGALGLNMITHQIHSNQAPSFMNAFRNVVSLPQCQTASYRCSCAGRPLRIQSINVE